MSKAKLYGTAERVGVFEVTLGILIFKSDPNFPFGISTAKETLAVTNEFIQESFIDSSVEGDFSRLQLPAHTIFREIVSEMSQRCDSYITAASDVSQSLEKYMEGKKGIFQVIKDKDVLFFFNFALDEPRRRLFHGQFWGDISGS